MERKKFFVKKIIDMFDVIDENQIQSLSFQITDRQDLIHFQGFVNRYLNEVVSSLYTEYPLIIQKDSLSKYILIRETQSQMESRKYIAKFWIIVIDNCLKLMKLSRQKEVEITDGQVLFDFITYKKNLMKFKAYCFREANKRVILISES